jgi:hypothetical protein
MLFFPYPTVRKQLTLHEPFLASIFHVAVHLGRKKLKREEKMWKFTRNK